MRWRTILGRPVPDAGTPQGEEPAPDRAEAGMSLLEYLLSAALFAGMLAGIAIKGGDAMQDIRAVNAARQIGEVARATESWLRDQGATLMTSMLTAPGMTMRRVPSDLSGYLADGFPAQNPYGQTYSIVVIRRGGPTAAVDDDTLEGIVVTQGPAIDPDRLAIAAAMVEGGGFVASSAGLGYDATVLQGAYGSYQIALSELTGAGASPQVGALGARVSVGYDAVVPEWLSRFAVPGHPELNAMSTDLRMDGAGTSRDILAARDVTAIRNIAAGANLTAGTNVTAGNDVLISGKNRWLSQAVQDVTVVQHGGTIDKPSCPPGRTPAVAIAPLRFAANSAGDLFTGVWTWVVDNGGSWTANMNLRTDTGWNAPNPTSLGVMAAFVKCD